ncbi:MAG: hypothetical protein KGO94_08165 [Alphaproteobacteria bacterium]|nr:hypothetical protein [Alphaproteobacteria bacterium]
MIFWRVPKPLAGGVHAFKYRFALVDHDICIMRFDNEAGKGDHKHIGKREFAYDFLGLKRLQSDFFDEVERLLR